MDRAQQLKAIALGAKSDEMIRQAQELAVLKRVSSDKGRLEKKVLTAALAGDSSTQFENLDALAAWHFRDLGFDISIKSRDVSEVSGKVAWKFRRKGDSSLNEFDANFVGWLTTTEGKNFLQRLFDALENAASLGRSGAKFSIESVKDGFSIGGKTKSPSPKLIGKILKHQGFRYDLIELHDERVEVKIFWL